MSITGEPAERALRAGVSLRSGRYLLVAPLGRGGFASVWRARDARDKREVAIKLLPAGDGGREAAEREAEVTARVKHPNVVCVLDTFCEEGWAGIVMELAAGSLADFVEEQGALPPAAALAVALQACAGLAEAHAAGVVHRDVKPHNLLLFPDGNVKVGDFGVARAEGHTRTRTANVVGSIPFMAPEQRRDPRAVRPATDVYALAVTTAWLLTGHAPGDLFAPGALGELVEAGVPVGLAEVLVRAGAYDARERPPEAGALAEALRGCGLVPEPLAETGALRGGVDREAHAGENHGAGGPRPPRNAPRERAGGGGGTLGDAPPSRMSGWAWPAGLMIALAAGGAGVWALPGSEGALRQHASEFAEATSLPDCLDTPSQWVERSSPSTAQSPEGLKEAVLPAAADVDLDGVTDLLWTHNLAAAVRIYWGSPAGAFMTSPVDVPMERAPCNVAVGDLDGDGRPDLLTASSERAKLITAFATGARAFGRRIVHDQAGEPCEVAVVDWQSDGRPDVLVRLREPGRVALRVNRGDGTLGPHVDLVAASGPFTAGPGADGKAILVAPQDGALTVYRADRQGPGFVRTGRVHLPEGVVRAVGLNGSSPVHLLVALSTDTSVSTADLVVRYEVGAAGQVTRGCRVRGAPRRSQWFGTLDGDGTLDALGTTSGAYTTSSYHLWLGERSMQAGEL